MQITVSNRPSFGMAMVRLEPGEEIIAEGGSMVAMSPSVDVETHFNGAGEGFVGMIQAMVIGMIRRFLVGETLFVNRYKGTSAGQHLMLAPALVGDVEHLSLDGGRRVTVQAGSYLASGPQVVIDLIWGGFSMLLSREGAFFLDCSGKGDLLINAYGALEVVDFEGSYVVDSGHVVAFEGALDYTISRAGKSWRTALLSGEGMVMTFSGKGRIWMQTRHLGSFLSWLAPLLPR